VGVGGGGGVARGYRGGRQRLVEVESWRVDANATSNSEGYVYT